MKVAEEAKENTDRSPDSERDTHQPPSLLYRCRAAIHERLPKLFEHPQTSRSRAYYRSKDPAENEKSTPPPDELVELRCLWAVEFYTPAHAENLIDGFRKLGWDQEDALSRNDPVRWVQRLRERPYGSGMLNLGIIRKPGANLFMAPYSRHAPLPPNVSYALAEMHGLTSSLTCIVVAFIIDDAHVRCYDEALRKDQQTYLKPLRRGHAILRPGDRKAGEVRRLREAARRGAAAWFCEHLPGLFASGVLGSEFPTCEFVTLRAARPFEPRAAGGGRAPEYLSVLGMDNDFRAWSYAGLPALRFSWPLIHDEDSRYHAVLAIREDDFADERKLHGESPRSALVHLAHETIKDLLPRWAMLPMLAGYGRHLNAIRDSAVLRQDAGRSPVAVLKSLGSHVSYSMDIAAVTAELIPFAGEPKLFDRDVEKFKPCLSSRNEDPEFTMVKGIRVHVTEQATWLQKTDQSLRDHLSQYGALVGAQENIRVQRRLNALTIVITVLTVVMAWMAIEEGPLIP